MTNPLSDTFGKLLGGTIYACEKCGLPSGSPLCWECSTIKPIPPQTKYTMTDPFLNLPTVFERLQQEYDKHKSLIVALDFDNTVYDYHQKGYEFPALIKLAQDCKAVGFKIVVFSGSAKERHPFIKDYLGELGIDVDGINEDLIDWHPDKDADWSGSKIYFNILLDDRAGLASAYQVLRLLVDNILSQKELDSYNSSL